MLSNLNQPLRTLPGIGLKRENLLESVGIETVGDLLLYLPYRYIDRTTEVGIAQLPLDMEVTVVGEIVAMEVIPGKRRRFVMTVEDDTGKVFGTWFGGYQYFRGAYEAGDLVALGGKLSRFGGKLAMTHPEVEVLASEGDEAQRLHTGRIIPLYNTTAKMKSERMTARALRRLLFAALDVVGDEIVDPLPDDIRERCGVVRLREAIEKVHFPDVFSDVDAARQRLAFDEIFYIQLHLGRMQKEREKTPGRVLCPQGTLAKQMVSSLPFELTGAQKRSVEEIGADLTRSVAMHRLLQGDVGSGKTLVALLAMLAAVDAGCQAALMAPTQILAEQHANTIRNLVEPLGLDVRLLTGRTRAAARREILVGLLSNTVSILIGTHALVQEDVLFANLGLVVVDEQHRFGVAQRAILREKGADSHLLVMTATPIPRSLALTLYGDLDVTILDELPPGREPVKTGWRLAADRAKALQFVRSEIEQGRQAYIVYPLVEESGKSDLKAATEAFEDLRTGSFSDLRLGLLHGRMTGDEKETTMDAFRRGDLQVLVATTVIEVGVDVPNATVMMVEHAERFGLSQLHQLRGRVGRGHHASYCILIADPQEHLSGEAKERLDAMAQTTDGFEISEVDLKIRGPGQIFGTRQAGFPEFRFADLARDVDIVVLARGEAQKLLNQDPTLASSDLLRQELDAIAWGNFQIVEAG
ncbi:MAG: ATP-dependent DNA helicase RecG [Candidatus Latescibacterota bacterium]|jgi:ATP-dependent DNA helicase RecG